MAAARVSRASYKRRAPRLRDTLLDLQAQLRTSKKFALAVIITGPPAAGRSETVNKLLEWLDPKHVSVRAFDAPDRAERKRPPMHRYWMAMTPRGRITFYFAGWYSDYLAPALRDPRKARPFEARAIERIRQLETMLSADRVRVLKVHLHIDAKTQRKRLARLAADPLTRWRVTQEDLWLADHHRAVKRAARHCREATDHGVARWRVIDGADEEHRVLAVGGLLRDELRRGLRAETRPAKAPPRVGKAALPLSARSAKLDLSAPPAKFDDARYEQTLERLQGRLALLVRAAKFRKHALVLAFEGMDAAGKGGAIRRIAHALDARQYQVMPVSAPTPEEMLHPYLHRFWKCAPALGEITIYDRSWYGRVLVERVRGFTPASRWARAYEEIREFELELAEHGAIVAKFWLDVGRKEQLKRFRERDADPLKRFKVDKEDWVNRRYYGAYQRAAAEMIRRTHMPHARWTAVSADDKKYARLEVLGAVCDAIERKFDAD